MNKTIVNIIGSLMPLVFLALQPAPAWADVPEYDLKAVYLERFTRFVEWPKESSMDDANKPFVVGVIGKNPFGSRIKEIFTKLKIKKKNIDVRYVSRMEDIDGCHLLFITGKTKQKLFEIVDYTKDKPILTVSDTNGYAKKGVYINFYIENKKLRFEINQTAVMQSRLRVSYMLMQHARILNPVKRPE